MMHLGGEFMSLPLLSSPSPLASNETRSLTIGKDSESLASQSSVIAGDPIGLYHFCGSSNFPATMPGTVISSSKFSHRRANPSTSTVTSASNSSVADAKRRNRSAGKLTVRPSWSSIKIDLFSAHARIAAGSEVRGGSARMAFMIGSFQLCLVFKYNVFDVLTSSCKR